MPRTEDLAEALGVSPEEVAAEQARRWDKGCEAHVELMRPMTVDRLTVSGWRLVYEGGDGLGCLDNPRLGLRLIHSVAREDDEHRWAHVSVSRRDGKMPPWDQLRDVFWQVYPGRFGIIVVAPETEHVNRAEVGHVWSDLDAPNSGVPSFAWAGSI